VYNGTQGRQGSAASAMRNSWRQQIIFYLHVYPFFLILIIFDDKLFSGSVWDSFNFTLCCPPGKGSRVAHKEKRQRVALSLFKKIF
jgi:hypothetical protein